MAKVIRGKRYRHETKKERGKKPLKADRVRRMSAKTRCTKLVGMGYSKEDIVDELMEVYDYSESSAIDIYDDTYNRLKYELSRKMTEIANVNWQRLETLIEDAYNDNDRKAVLEAIEKQNKMANLYEQKININGVEGFTIKLDK